MKKSVKGLIAFSFLATSAIIPSMDISAGMKDLFHKKSACEKTCETIKNSSDSLSGSTDSLSSSTSSLSNSTDNACDSKCDAPKIGGQDPAITVACGTAVIEQPNYKQKTAITNYETKLIEQPDIIERVPEVVRETHMVKQAPKKILVPVVTYKEELIPQPDLEVVEEKLIMREKRTKQAPILVDLRKDSVKEECFSQPALEVCQADVKIEKPANTGCETKCESKLAQKFQEMKVVSKKISSFAKDEALQAKGHIRLMNTTAYEQTFVITYFSHIHFKNIEYTVAKGASLDVNCDGLHKKHIFLKGSKTEVFRFNNGHIIKCEDLMIKK